MESFAMATTDQITTAKQLLETPNRGPCELVRGELAKMTPAGFEHGRIVGLICTKLGSYVERRRLGIVMGAESGFQLARDPDTVRAPDVAFLQTDRVPGSREVGFFQGAPDLAVEVLSPSDRASQTLAKVRDWLDAGCRAVWVVDPETRTVTVYRGENRVDTLTVSDLLDSQDVVPGFTLPVAELFPPG
jgi:Uma2 family endonuclease